MVTIISFVRDNQFWLVVAFVLLPSGTRVGPYVIDLNENAEENEIKAAILALYQ